MLCDIWGVLHDGQKAFAAAVDALQRHRGGGGVVVLITNAPRPANFIAAQLQRLGVARDCYDAIVTSGDVAIDLVAQWLDRPVAHIGPQRDISLIEAAAQKRGVKPIMSDLAQAASVICTGLFDDINETPSDYEARLREMSARGQIMICANPDIIVHRGSDILYCAGALAQRFKELGGAVIYSGKPYAPIYDQALRLGREAGGAEFGKAQVLAIGDGLPTDMRGAADYGLATLFISAGIHQAHEHGAEALGELCARHNLSPNHALDRLRWA